MPISSTATLQQVAAADSIPSNTGPICIPNIQIPANLGNLGVKLRQQTTASDVTKGIRDGHAQKENSHKIKGNNCNYFNKALPENYEGNKKPENKKHRNEFISVKGNLKKHLPFWEKNDKNKQNNV